MENKDIEAYPECFMKTRKGTKQIHLIGGSNELDFSDHPLNFDELTNILNELHRTSKFPSNGWSRNPEDDRTGADIFALPAVQHLFNFTRTTLHAIKWMKKESIDAGVAQHNPKTGKFEFINSKEEEDGE